MNSFGFAPPNLVGQQSLESQLNAGGAATTHALMRQRDRLWSEAERQFSSRAVSMILRRSIGWAAKDLNRQGLSILTTSNYTGRNFDAVESKGVTETDSNTD